MADDPENEKAEVEGDDEERLDTDDTRTLSQKLGSKKKLVVLALIPLLLIGAGAGVYFSGLLDGVLGKGAKDEADLALEEEANQGPGAFIELPDLLVNLDTPDSGPRFLKIGISLEVADAEAVLAVETALPRVVDHFQVYLRELRVEDLRGSSGVFRLRQELMARVAAAAHPVKVRDVLFREILIQ